MLLFPNLQSRSGNVGCNGIDAHVKQRLDSVGIVSRPNHNGNAVVVKLFDEFRRRGRVLQVNVGRVDFLQLGENAVGVFVIRFFFASGAQPGGFDFRSKTAAFFNRVSAEGDNRRLFFHFSGSNGGNRVRFQTILFEFNNRSASRAL